mmetsp:Transcript_3442/g.5729  ORF Transcript_3442/g.5729 Transcript_3442/m.5729 type:complete len:144 (+) Transcript_3442:81-512(+)
MVRDDNGDGDNITIDESSIEEKKNTLSSNLYIYVVNLISEFVAAILSHPKVSAALNTIIMTAMNCFMDQPDLADKIHNMSAAMMTDMGRHEDTARILGKDVPKLVSGFMGGLASNMPSIRKKKDDVEVEGPTSVANAKTKKGQ